VVEVTEKDRAFVSALLKTAEMWPGHEAAERMREAVARHREAATAAKDAELQIAQKVIRSWTEYGEQKEEIIAAKDAEIEALRAENERLRETLGKIAGRAAELRKGTDDWFELTEFELCARTALKDSQP
jgi:predicted nuclease with TOPRIM domain